MKPESLLINIPNQSLSKNIIQYMSHPITIMSH